MQAAIPVFVTVQYAYHGVKESRRFKVSMDNTVGATVRALVKSLALPSGEYELHKQRQPLEEDKKLYEVGVTEGDILQLLPFDPNATVVGKALSANLMNRLGSRASDDILDVAAQLVSVDGHFRFKLRRTRAMIGRADPKVGYPPESLDADLTALDPQRTVSRPHALIVYHNGQFSIRDLYSQLGVMLNGVKIAVNAAQPLQDGDKLTIGDVEMVFRIG